MRISFVICSFAAGLIARLVLAAPELTLQFANYDGAKFAVDILGMPSMPCDIVDSLSDTFFRCKTNVDYGCIACCWTTGANFQRLLRAVE